MAIDREYSCKLPSEEWREEKKRKRAQMAAMQKLPYEIKVKRAELRAGEFVEKLDDMGLEAHVSVGGLDSILLSAVRTGYQVGKLRFGGMKDE